MPHFAEKRRSLLKTSLTTAASLFFLKEIPVVQAQTDKKLVACTFHGINGNPQDGIIGDLNRVLTSAGYQVHSPQMPGGILPIKEEWDGVAQELLNRVKPDITFWYSLGVRTMLRLGTVGDSPMGNVVSLSGRRPDVDITQFDLADPRHDFYNGGVDVNRFVENIGDRSCFSAPTDGTVPFRENALQLAQAIKANHICFEVGQGHFDLPGKTLEFAQGIVDVSKRWGILS